MSCYRLKFYFSGVLLFIFFLLRCTDKNPESQKNLYASLNDTVKYVGINACRQCHSDIYETFIHTGMGASFDLASAKKSSAYFNHAVIYDSIKNFYYKAFWENDSLKFLEFRLSGKDTVHKRIEAINYIVGSGQHTNSHIYNLNGYLHQAPMTFYTQQGKWDLPPGFENGGNSRFSRQIGLECMTCHNGLPDFVLGSENKYNAMKNGIDCERCHGPGEKHVKDKLAGKLVDITKEIDYSIVNPSKLPVDRQMDVCQRCHIQGNAVLNDEKSFFDFRPGMKLSDVMNVFMPVFSGRHDEHIMASHAERLKMSRCFTETVKSVEKNKNANELKPYKNALTCITCHNPHVSVRATNQDVFNTACKNCHSELHVATPSPLRKDGMQNCVNCHMANSTATDIPHVRITDHFIRKPIIEKELESVKRFIGIACINNPAPPDQAKGKAFIAYVEKFNYGKELLDSAKKYFDDNSRKSILENFHSLVHIAFLKKDYAKIAFYESQAGNALNFLNRKSYSNTDAWTCYRIGEAFKNSGKAEKALEYYSRATILAPFVPEFQNVYGAALISAGKTQDAKKVFEFVLKENPKNPQALSNLGFILISRENRVAEAKKLYQQAIALDPDYMQAHYNMAGLYIYSKRFDEAKKYLAQILAAHPADEKAKQILNSIIEL